MCDKKSIITLKYMKLKRILAAATIFAVFAAGLSAKPARRGTTTVTQPDGTTVTLRLVGDERAHCLMTADERPVVQIDDTYYFAIANADGSLTSTGIQACDDAEMPADRHARVNAIAPRITPSQLLTARAAKSRYAKRSIAQSGMGLAEAKCPAIGDVHALVILVEFSDIKFKLSDPYEYFNGMLTQEGFSEYGGTGSARDYFLEASMGKFTPHFDVYGPVTMSNKCAYYGGNDSWGEDMRPEEMVIEACKALDSTIDFSQYDTDNDGCVDNVYVIYAGYGEASSDLAYTIWPHSWTLDEAGKSLVLDGKKINLYGCSNEWEDYNGQGRPDGIGTFVHEFSHILGLPDLYDTTTNYNSDNYYATPGSWSVLDYGPYNNDGRTPPMYSMYERNALQWCEPEVIDGPLDGTLENLADSNHGYIILTNTEREFFLLENRQQTGWDTYLPGHGMLIWHIDADQSYFANNTVNNNKKHHYVDLVEANGIANNSLTSYLKGFPFPGTSNVTSFTADTKPALRDWNNNAIDLPITDIAEKNGVITFKVAGGGSPMAAPQTLTASNIDQTGFTASWDAVDEATDYLLTVSMFKTGIEVVSECDFGSGSSVTLPAGWTSSTTECYGTNSKGYFGESAPAIKLGKEKNTEHYLMTPLFNDDIKSMTYWERGASTSGNSTVTLSGLVNGSWKTIEEYDVDDTAATHEVKNIPEGTKQIKIVYNKKNGNLALDDIKVVSGGAGYVVLPGYNGVSTEGETSMRVNVDRSQGTKLQFFVRATDGDRISRASEAKDVELTLSVANVSADETNLNIAGRTVTADAYITVCDLTGRVIAEGNRLVTIKAAGLYVITAGDITRKAVIK